MTVVEFLETSNIEIERIKIFARLVTWDVNFKKKSSKDDKWLSVFKGEKENITPFDELSFYYDNYIHKLKIQKNGDVKIYLTSDEVLINEKKGDFLTIINSLLEGALLLKKGEEVILYRECCYEGLFISKNWKDEELFPKIWDAFITYADIIDYLDISDKISDGFDYKKGDRRIIQKAIDEGEIKIMEDE